MTRHDYLTQRHLARHAIRALALLPPPPCSTWQDKDRAQEWVRICTNRLPEHEYARPYSYIDAQTRLSLSCQFPLWQERRNQLWHRQRDAAVRARIHAIVDRLAAASQPRYTDGLHA